MIPSRNFTMWYCSSLFTQFIEGKSRTNFNVQTFYVFIVEEKWVIRKMGVFGKFRFWKNFVKYTLQHEKFWLETEKSEDFVENLGFRSNGKIWLEKWKKVQCARKLRFELSWKKMEDFDWKMKNLRVWQKFRVKLKWVKYERSCCSSIWQHWQRVGQKRCTLYFSVCSKLELSFFVSLVLILPLQYYFKLKIPFGCCTYFVLFSLFLGINDKYSGS